MAKNYIRLDQALFTTLVGNLGEVLEGHSGCVDGSGRIRDTEEFTAAAVKMFGIGPRLAGGLYDALTTVEWAERAWRTERENIFAALTAKTT
jgi:hypothetical protein